MIQKAKIFNYVWQGWFFLLMNCFTFFMSGPIIVEFMVCMVWGFLMKAVWWPLIYDIYLHHSLDWIMEKCFIGNYTTSYLYIRVLFAGRTTRLNNWALNIFCKFNALAVMIQIYKKIYSFEHILTLTYFICILVYLTLDL